MSTVSPGYVAELEPAEAEAPPAGRAVFGRLVRDRTALVGLLLVAAVLLIALLAPLIAPHDPNLQDVVHRLEGPSLAHPLGTDNLGRDELSRILVGARISLLVAVAIGVAILVIGVAVGTTAGFAGGVVDAGLMRLVDLLLAFPSLLLALAVAGVLGPSLLHLAIAMTAVWWAEYARLVRGLVLGVKERPFVEAARALGLPPWRIAVRHVLPHLLPPVLVLGTLRVGSLLLALAALSFLGLGVSPPTPEWGTMLNDGQDYLASAPQLMLYPGLAITLSALGFNLLGDGLRDLLDPRLR